MASRMDILVERTSAAQDALKQVQLDTDASQSLVAACESVELGLTLSLQGSEEGYKQVSRWLPVLMLAYCLDGDLPSCKFLWERTRKELKSDELHSSFLVAKALMKKDYTSFYELMSRESAFSPNTQIVADALTQRTRSQLIQALPKLFGSSVPISKAVEYSGLDTARATAYCLERGWTIDGESLLAPPSSSQRPPIHSSMLKNLADEVVLLERNIVLNATEIIEQEKEREKNNTTPWPKVSNNQA